MNEDTLRAAHRHSIKHRSEIIKSLMCGCFYCLRTYPHESIETWLEEGDGTALCPECSIDSVIGDASGFDVTDPAFLLAMNAFWFERTAKWDERAGGGQV